MTSSCRAAFASAGALLVALSLFLSPVPALAVTFDTDQIGTLLTPCTYADGAAESPSCVAAVDTLAMAASDDYQARWEVCESIHALEDTSLSALAPRSVAALNARLVRAGLYRYDCRLSADPPSPTKTV